MATDGGRLASLNGSHIVRRTLFNRSLILTAVLSLILLSSGLTAGMQSSSANQAFLRPIHLLFLIDSSGSMKNTDNLEIRKLAAQSILSVLSQEDHVAVVEFDEGARILADWTRGSERATLFNAVNRVGNRGEYTDFRAGLDKAFSLFNDIEEESRKIVFLLSDGLFEPNLKSDIYAPYNVEFQKEILGKSAAQRRLVKNKYQEKILPVARRIVESEIIPSLLLNRIEVFTVAFSPESDKETLRQYSQLTNLNHPEVHHFYAEKATDLFGAFVEILSYWKNLLVVHKKEGVSYPGLEAHIFLDEFLEEAFFQFYTSDPATVELWSEKGVAFTNIPGTHPNLKIFPIGKKFLPGAWSYKYVEGKTEFREIVVGKSNLTLEVEGLAAKYLFGEQIEAVISACKNGVNAFHLLDPNSRIQGLITDEAGRTEEIGLRAEGGQFRLQHRTTRPGRFRLRFTLVASSRDGVDIRPRPSKEYAFEVIPDYFIEPTSVDFGDLKSGQAKTAEVIITSGFDTVLELTMSAGVTQASRCIDRIEKLPKITEMSIWLEKPGRHTKEIEIIIPEEGCWGDFEGEIRFAGDNDRIDLVRYRVHVPSWREWITLSLIIIGILLLAALGYLAIIWGHLGTPRGVIRFVTTPPGIVKEDVIIGRLKRGILTKLFNWRRNIISLGETGTDIVLDSVPAGVLIRLKFFRFGGNYIENANSGRITDPTILVRDPVVEIEIERGPNQQYRLKSGTEIIFGEYRIVFHDI